MTAPTKFRARIVFLLRVPLEYEYDFLDAYEQIRYEVARGVPGHIRDQVCRSATDPERWLITSEWRDLDSFVAWEATEGHRELAAPLRRCFTEAQSLRFEICAETSAAEHTEQPAAAG